MLKKKTDIVILGSGIGGYEAFRKLNKKFKKHKIKKRITLIDRNNYFTFTPMLHEAASGSILPNHAAVPIRECVSKTPHEFWKTTVNKIDPAKKKVYTSEGEIEYKYCILALGSETNYYGVKGAKKYSEHIRNLPAALHLHQKLISTLEDHKSNKMKVVVVGGGATGIELAGQLCHLDHRDIKKLYPKKEFTVTIIQAQGDLMQYSPPVVRELAKKELKKRGVRVLLNSTVNEVKNDSVVLSSGKEIKCNMVVWTAGFTNTGINYIPEKYCERGLVKVNEYLQSEKESSIYTIGDISLAIDQRNQKPYPKLGEVAYREGAYVAKHLTRRILKKECKPFHFKSHGQIIPIGDWYAIANIGPFKFKGRLAWWLRRTIYLAFIPGFTRKLRIVIDWTLHSLGIRHMINLDLGPDNENEK